MIDWHRVRELQEEVGVEDFTEVAELFLEEADEVVERLGAGVNPNMLEAEFHALKGSALNLGFAELAELCSREERRAADGLINEIDISGTVARYQASKELFQAHRDACIAAE